MTMALHSKFTRNTTVLAAVALLAFASGACSKKKVEAEKAPAPSASAPSDPNADGKRLERAVNDWKRRWERIELEKCETLLTEAADLELCKKSEAALVKVKEHANKLDKSEEAIKAAGALIETSEAAIDKLRTANMAALAASAPSGKPAASPAPKAKPAGSVAAKPKVKPSGSGVAPTGSAELARREDPGTKVVSSYERVARSAARYLGSFLQQGQLDVRKQAFAEVMRLVPLRERWLTLRDVVRQASLTEREPDLRKQLRDIEQKLRASMPNPPGAPSGMPGMPPGAIGRPMGRPPMPGPGGQGLPGAPAKAPTPPPAPPQ